MERVSGPAAFGLHDVEGNASEQVLEGGAYPYAVPLQWFEPRGTRGTIHPLEELGLGERATGGVFGTVRE